MKRSYDQLYPEASHREEVEPGVFKVLQAGECYECCSETPFMEMYYMLYVCSSKCLEAMETKSGEPDAPEKYKRIRTQEP